MTKYAAHPTIYKGFQMRSRLEARWACYFEQRAWTWIYEPFDLQGYVPDFSVGERETPDLDTEVKTQWLVEVKPATKIGQLKAPIAKLLRTGWKGPWMVVGADPDVCMTGKGKHHQRRRYLGRENPKAWADACNITQWKPAAIVVCPRCGRQDHRLHKIVCPET